MKKLSLGELSYVCICVFYMYLLLYLCSLLIPADVLIGKNMVPGDGDNGDDDDNDDDGDDAVGVDEEGDDDLADDIVERDAQG